MTDATTRAFSYKCDICSLQFQVVRAGVVRCRRCGSLATMDLPPEPPQASPEPPQASDVPPRAKTGPNGDRAGEFLARYACVGCARQFFWNHTKKGSLSPTCPTCKSADVVARSPNARVFVISKTAGTPALNQKTMTRSEAKRWRFITRNWRLRCELKEHLDRTESLLTRIGVDGPRTREVKRALDALLAEVDAKQKELLELHNNAVEAAKVRA